MRAGVSCYDFLIFNTIIFSCKHMLALGAEIGLGFIFLTVIKECTAGEAFVRTIIHKDDAIVSVALPLLQMLKGIDDDAIAGEASNSCWSLYDFE